MASPACFSEAFCQALGLARQQDWPIAPLTARAAGLDVGDAYWLRLDPVYLEVGMRGLFVRADMELEATEAKELHAILFPLLAAHLAPRDMAFFPSPNGVGHIRMAAPPSLATTPLDQVDGRQPMGFLPTGKDAPFWALLLHEIQMVLHDPPFNEARVAAGRLPINSLWPWGGGRFMPPVQGVDAVWGDVPLLRQMAAAVGIPCHSRPPGLDQVLAASHKRGLVVLEEAESGLADGTQSQKLEAEWFHPLLTALRFGRLHSVQLTWIGDAGHGVKLTLGDAWRFWV